MERFVVIDLETTGHSAVKRDKIIEVGIVVIEENEVVDSYGTFLNPGKSIPEFISSLTGIRDEDVKDAPTFEERAEEIAALFEDSYLIAHNVPFDMGFINAEFAAVGRELLQNPVLDTVELARVLYPKAPSYKLGQLAEYLGIHHEDPHRALSDAYVTAKLFLKLRERLDNLPYETITHLIRLEKMLKSDLFALLADRENELAFSTQEDPELETFQGLAFKKIKETKNTPQTRIGSYGDFLDAIYEEGGTLSQQMARYEKRTGQREMSETIYDAFQSRRHALIEAETGTGKSLAYILPAIYDAVISGQRLVISTFTTQLQTQLLEEEIPLIRSLLPFSFKATLLKGKSHYISLEKFERELLSTDKDNYDITLTKAMILVWLTETQTGDIDEVQLPSSGYLFFRRVSTDTEAHVDPQSPWFLRSYYQKARKAAQQADIVITNHALIATDIFNDYQLLPSYDKVIIDEAHHFEETASKHYGLKLDYMNMQYTLNQIGETNDPKFIGQLITKYRDFIEEEMIDRWDDLIIDAKYETDDLFRGIFQYVAEQNKHQKSLSDIGRTQYRFENSKEDTAKWDTILEMTNRLMFFLRDLIYILARLDQTLAKQYEDKYDKNEVEQYIEQLQQYMDHLESLFLAADSPKFVKWVEVETYGAKNAVYLYSEPTDISGFLSTDFFAKKESVILTSATLTMKNSFTFIKERLGLTDEEIETKKIPSPFSYKDQVQLMIPTDFPDIKHGNQDDFIYATCEAIFSLAEITSGRMLVLFTSYDMLKKSYYLLKEIMDTSTYALIAQGISSGSRSRLKKNFQTFDQSILLGTSSFWEGVDIPGEDLSSLVIVRLPFQPPDHPIFEAKSANLKENGKNAFMELSLPNAVIRFKQGFGRLIRSNTDRGIVFVCDSRIIQARYGKYFLDSIPEIPLTKDTTQQLMRKAEEWF
ncbi:DNA polymerase III subunit epsilon [Oceanobacillus picturae]|uniref:3'-5' exonuclease DinG n=1 Tax=Oceanobacillus picturae TaxID=171693 RepID=A0A0U9H815_9BACI|nr:ATP-dependent DNA helicase DinG [Oceanobacillus picturae]GAQ17425.1 DNA polymerase III subunit epsilon [Oceanobacillus picturae]